MIDFDQNTILALLPPAGTVVLAFLLVVIVDLARPGRDGCVTSSRSVGCPAADGADRGHRAARRRTSAC